MIGKFALLFFGHVFAQEIIQNHPESWQLCKKQFWTCREVEGCALYEGTWINVFGCYLSVHKRANGCSNWLCERTLVGCFQRLLPTQEGILSQLVLDSLFFSFDNVIYRQSFGIPIGSPISPIIADLVMRRLETVSLMSVNMDILFYYRYVDDICTALPPSQIDVLLERFNSFHARLQFTVERGGKTINFLDVTVSVNNNRFNFDWYRKSTFSGRFLNFHSNHWRRKKAPSFH